MMGTKAENALAPPPKESIKFIEDMDMDDIPSMVCLALCSPRIVMTALTETSITHLAHSTSLGW